MTKILHCVPNISEGRDKSIINAAADAIRAVKGVKLLAVAPDADHNRTVYSFAGEPDSVLEAAKALALTAIEHIDMSVHHGIHPRIGAVDVTPFIPVKEVNNEEALDICRQYGKWVGNMGIPVYYYEYASTKNDRTNLANIRKGEYEGLENKLRDPDWTPDEGPAVFVPKSGAFMAGVRHALIAFNVNLRCTDLTIAKRIAESVRFINGGYRYVKAIGLPINSTGMVQVSMNLIDYTKTPVHRVLETIRSEAARYGVEVAGTEVIGTMPAKAVEDIVKFYLQCHNFNSDQILELNLD